MVPIVSVSVALEKGTPSFWFKHLLCFLFEPIVVDRLAQLLHLGKGLALVCADSMPRNKNAQLAALARAEDILHENVPATQLSHMGLRGTDRVVPVIDLTGDPGNVHATQLSHIGLKGTDRVVRDNREKIAEFRQVFAKRIQVDKLVKAPPWHPFWANLTLSWTIGSHLGLS